MKSNFFLILKNLPFLLKGKIFFILFTFFLSSSIFAQKNSLGSSNLYFPKGDSEVWEQVSLDSLGWDKAELTALLHWLAREGTRGFLILKNGKMVVEEYWGSKLTGMGTMDKDGFWYWASAGKTLTSVLVGLAEEEKLFKLKDPSSKYLGEGWTSVTLKQEKDIRIFNHLSMTTGLDDRIENRDNTNAEFLRFFARPDSRWAYHNAPYTLLPSIIEKVSGKTYQEYFKEKLGQQIGMNGFWQMSGNSRIFYSDLRSMARFGLLLLNEGVWEQERLLNQKYFSKMTTASQSINPSYGLLTWLNSGSSYMLPDSPVTMKGNLIPPAPKDMFMALGKNGQYIFIVPSQELVIVRIGVTAQANMSRRIWERLARVIPMD